MTAEQFNSFWTDHFPGTSLLSYRFRTDYPDRWVRIHSLPLSKRYAETEEEWNILFHRQNMILTDVMGDRSEILIVVVSNLDDDEPEQVNGPKTALDRIDLYKADPEIYGEGQFFYPLLYQQTWQPHKFDRLLKKIAEWESMAFFVALDNGNIVAPYDGGLDLILKDRNLRDAYKEKYKDWLSYTESGL